MSGERRRAAEGKIGVGTRVRVSRTFTASDLARFGEITHDHNPVHYDPRWSAQKGYAQPVCHGLLVGSLLCEPGGQWGWLASGMSFRFRAPVYPGDTVTCELSIVEVDERQRARAACVFTNQRDEVVLTADLWGHLPCPEEQALLATMIAEGDPTNPLRD